MKFVTGLGLAAGAVTAANAGDLNYLRSADSEVLDKGDYDSLFYRSPGNDQASEKTLIASKDSDAVKTGSHIDDLAWLFDDDNTPVVGGQSNTLFKDNVGEGVTSDAMFDKESVSNPLFDDIAGKGERNGLVMDDVALKNDWSDLEFDDVASKRDLSNPLFDDIAEKGLLRDPLFDDIGEKKDTSNPLVDDYAGKGELSGLIMDDIALKGDTSDPVFDDIAAKGDTSNSLYDDIAGKGVMSDPLFDDIAVKGGMSDPMYDDNAVKEGIEKDSLYDVNVVKEGTRYPLFDDIAAKGDMSDLLFDDIAAKGEKSDPLFDDIGGKGEMSNPIFDDIAVKEDTSDPRFDDIGVKGSLRYPLFDDIAGKDVTSDPMFDDIAVKGEMSDPMFDDIAAKRDMGKPFFDDIAVKESMNDLLFGDIAVKQDVNDPMFDDLAGKEAISNSVSDDNAEMGGKSDPTLDDTPFDFLLAKINVADVDPRKEELGQINLDLSANTRAEANSHDGTSLSEDESSTFSSTALGSYSYLSKLLQDLSSLRSEDGIVDKQSDDPTQMEDITSKSSPTSQHLLLNNIEEGLSEKLDLPCGESSGSEDNSLPMKDFDSPASKVSSSFVVEYTMSTLKWLFDDSGSKDEDLDKSTKESSFSNMYGVMGRFVKRITFFSVSSTKENILLLEESASLAIKPSASSETGKTEDNERSVGDIGLNLDDPTPMNGEKTKRSDPFVTESALGGDYPVQVE